MPSSFLFVIIKLNCLDTVLTSMHWESNLLCVPAGGSGQGQMTQSVSYPLNSPVLSSLTRLVVFICIYPAPTFWMMLFLPQHNSLYFNIFGGGRAFYKSSSNFCKVFLLWNSYFQKPHWKPFHISLPEKTNVKPNPTLRSTKDLKRDHSACLNFLLLSCLYANRHKWLQGFVVGFFPHIDQHGCEGWL